MVGGRNKFVARPVVAEHEEPRIRRLLIANRGEIACRIISTCKELGIASIAIYTDEDQDSLHVGAADESVCLGSIQDEAGNPHQNPQLIINTAVSHHADAVHPGYGYLSENANFAKQVQQAGLIFVGPSPHAISVLGDKRQAKDFLLREAPEVPLVPGYTGTAQDTDTLQQEAVKIGFPVMIKAAAGGGGKGMRIVYDEASLRSELGSAQSEARRSFGSSDCLLEKYIERSKHIEIQIVGDSSGNVISLGDRECSVQRRHQKIVEEAPSPWLGDAIRKRMSDCAVTIGRLLQYESVGTVEFIVDIKNAEFYFLEVNTRIQVEHAITEEIMGLDIVALQLYIVSGGLLRNCAALSDLTRTGHSIECRLCAEDPMLDFMPDSGRILRWTAGNQFLSTEQSQGVRIETAVHTGSKVSVHFDSMIAKIIIWAPDRRRAIVKMLDVLRHTIIVGIKTNHLFLQACLLNHEFGNINYTTNFIPDNISRLLLNPYKEEERKWRESLCFLPGLFSRWITDTTEKTPAYRPFGSIQTRFRNQPFDKSNTLQDVVNVESTESPKNNASQSFLVIWSNNRGTPTNTFRYRTQLLSKRAPEEAEALDDPETKSDPGTQLARHFNATFTDLLNGAEDLLNGAEDPAKYHTLRLLNSSIEDHKANDSSKSWLSARITISHDNIHQTYNLTTSPTFHTKRAPGVPEQIFVSIPDLGTSIPFERHTLLSWGESQRNLFSSDAAVDELRIYTSVMPCKILRILKATGDQVQAGEAMLVVESMKTEVKIVAAVDGTFSSEVKEGDAVGDGVVLCKLT